MTNLYIDNYGYDWSENFSNFQNLTSFTLDVNQKQQFFQRHSNDHIENFGLEMAELGEGISKLQKLTSLNLNFSYGYIGIDGAV